MPLGGPFVPGTVNFVPADCEALHIADCLIHRAAKLEDLALPSLTLPGGFLDAAIASLPEMQVDINVMNLCIEAALQQAFLKAGCPFPTIPDEVEEPDLSTCQGNLQQFGSDAADQLGVAQGIVSITFNASGIPTQIRA